MDRSLIIQAFRFITLILLQGLVFINIDLFHGRMQALVYVLFVLMMPLRTPPLLVMGMAFLLGLGVDMFYNSPGVHASASVVIGFARSRILELLAPRDGYDMKDSADIGSLGVLWFMQYSFFMIVVHHLWLFLIEAFQWSSIGVAGIKAILSAILTFVMILIGQFLFHGRKRDSL